nr:MAG TPA: hypothetical protein [Caudoviricetes sp.]
MDLKRWGKRVYTIDYRAETAEEVEYVLEWLQNNPGITATVVMSGKVFTFKATNKDIVNFYMDMVEYHNTGAKLEEMEAYYNEH